MDKILAFEYLLLQMIKHLKLNDYAQKDEKEIAKEFSRLKSLKLLFLAATASKSKTDEGLLKTFDSFYAMQYGPVESSIYDAITQNTLPHFNISLEGTTLTGEIQSCENEISNDLDDQERKSLNNALNQLLQRNPKILSYTPFELVKITHKWKVWKEAYNFALFMNKRSEKMDMSNLEEKGNFIYV